MRSPMSSTLIALSLILCAGIARADLQPYRDYTVSDSILDITTVRVHANMRDAYLEGLRKTWVATMAIAKRLGQVEGYRIYVSDLPRSGDFNMMLEVKFKNDEQLAPNKQKYEAFMKAWGSAHEKEAQQIAQKDYPGMRSITGEYHMRELTFIK